MTLNETIKDSVLSRLLELCSMHSTLRIWNQRESLTDFKNIISKNSVTHRVERNQVQKVYVKIIFELFRQTHIV